MTPSFQEAPISQIPVRMWHHTIRISAWISEKATHCFPNKPATPLTEAHFGGYFFALEPPVSTDEIVDAEGILPIDGGRHPGGFSPVFRSLASTMGGGIVNFSRQSVLEHQGSVVSQISRIRACKVRTMCELNLNRPATPLYDAHQGGCFMYGSRGNGGWQ